MNNSLLKKHSSILLKSQNKLRFLLLSILQIILLVRTITTQALGTSDFSESYYLFQYILQVVLLAATQVIYFTSINRKNKRRAYRIIMLIFYSIAMFNYFEVYPIAITVMLLGFVVLEIISMSKIMVLVLIIFSIAGDTFYKIISGPDVNISMIMDIISIIAPFLVILLIGLRGIDLLNNNQKAFMEAITKLSNKIVELNGMAKSLVGADDEMRGQYEELYKKAYLDGQTGLNNKAYLYNLLKGLCDDEDSTFTLLLIGANNFRMMDELHSFNISDDIYYHIANNLREVNNDRFEIGYFTGDIYYVITETNDEAEQFAKDISKRYASPIETSVATIDLQVHVGLYNKTVGCKSTTAVNYAEVALYQAKRDKNSDFTTFSKDLLK